MEEVIKVLNEEIIKATAGKNEFVNISFKADYVHNRAVEGMVQYYTDKIATFERAIEILKSK